MNPPRPKLVLAGGSGLIGSLFAGEAHQRGYDVIILTRGAERSENGIRFRHWDGRQLGPWAEELEGARAIINLTGRHVDCRYNRKNRRAILESRVRSVRVLAAAIEQTRQPPPVFIQLASLAIYGHQGEQVCTEATPPGTGFSPRVCLSWENAIRCRIPESMRSVILRVSFVLDRKRGALGRMLALTRWGLGGSVGSGRQWMSWIHPADLNVLIIWAIEDASMAGVYNATAPEPIRNRDLMRELRRAIRRPWSPPAPSWLVPIGCFFLRTEAELALRSRYGVPNRLTREGFRFRYTRFPEALDDIMAEPPSLSAR